ncbi:protein kinase superfamily protein [Wolffia australiana]
MATDLSPIFSTGKLVAMAIAMAVFFFELAEARQPFIANKQFDCYGTNASSALGYACSSRDLRSCPAFLFFRPRSIAQSPSQIARLLSSDPISIASINGAIAPITCSCSNSRFYQSNTSYIVRSDDEIYLSIANDTFQGLTTCQALMAQNPSHDSRDLYRGINLLVPLRCACPSKDQRAAGFKFLLTYLIAQGDTIDQIAAAFGVDPRAVLDANSLNSTDTIYPFNSLLIPLQSEPSAEDLISPPPSPPPPPPPPPPEKSSRRKPTILGIAIGASATVVLGFAVLILWFLIFRKRRRGHGEKEKIKIKIKKKAIPSEPPLEEKIRHAMIGSAMIMYKFEELEKATNSFSEENRINSSSVYRAVIGAVKRTKADVQNEIVILNQINHANVIRLSGFCRRPADAFLVYEFAELGSLGDLLHRHRHRHRLDWCRRVRIACDVADALNYLHSGVRPAVVHMNVTSSHVLVTGELRAKLGNFAMARPVERGGGPAELTTHVIGTRGYLAPEYLDHGLVSAKLDVFAFGVVLIELVSGKSAAEAEEKKEERLTVTVRKVVEGEDTREKVTRFVDPGLGGEFPFELVFAMAQLAARCVADDYNSRPSSGELLVALTAILSSSLDWDPAEISHSDSASEHR